MLDLMVRKKDGTTEPFDRNKILNGLLKSGATQIEAEGVVTQIENWAPSMAVNGFINSLDIRLKVLELLREINPAAATAFENYRKASGPSEPPTVPPSETTPV